MKVEIQSRWTLDSVKNNPNKLYIFGDNDVKSGKGGQAIIRDLSNAIGIPTKKYPNYKNTSYYTDDELEENKKKIDIAIKAVIEESKKEQYDTIVFPKDGFGTGLAKLPTKAPKTFEYLNERVDSCRIYLHCL